MALIIDTVIPCLLAPLLYFTAGAPWAWLAGRPWLSPLLGVAVFGCMAELAAMLALPVQWLTAVGMVVPLGLLGIQIARGRIDLHELGQNLRCFCWLFVIALFPVIAVPFAIPGGWGGDWIVALESGRHLFEGKALSGALLSRPPFFGVAAAPLWLVGGSLQSYQVVCAVGSACALQVFRVGIGSGSSSLLWIFSGSIFFLHITANAWPKFMAAAYVVGAWQVLRNRRPGESPVVAAILTGLGLATHQSSVLFVPLLLTQVPQPEIARLTRHEHAKMLVFFLLVAACFFLPWELYTVWRYSLAAKLSANPAVADRLQDIPTWANMLLVGLTTLIGWGPVNVLKTFPHDAATFEVQRLGALGYWVVTSTLNTLAGTLVGVGLPCWLALGSRRFVEAMHRLWRASAPSAKVAVGVAFLGQMVLNPFFSADGTLQTGWVPAGIGVLIWLAHEVTRAGEDVARRAKNITLLLSLVPWTLFQGVLSGGLQGSLGLRRQFVDSDFEYVKAHHLTSLGMAYFPWLLLAVVALMILGNSRLARQTS